MELLFSWCKQRRPCQVIHISREINGVSHALAQHGRIVRCNEVWPRSGPDIIRVACNQDDTPVPSLFLWAESLPYY